MGGWVEGFADVILFLGPQCSLHASVATLLLRREVPSWEPKLPVAPGPVLGARHTDELREQWIWLTCFILLWPRIFQNLLVGSVWASNISVASYSSRSEKSSTDKVELNGVGEGM